MGDGDGLKDPRSRKTLHASLKFAREPIRLAELHIGYETWYPLEIDFDLPGRSNP